jgi:hypothetical protein
MSMVHEAAIDHMRALVKLLVQENQFELDWLGLCKSTRT